jgi:hypothetical protein
MVKFYRVVFLIVVALIASYTFAQTPANTARGFSAPDPNRPIGLLQSTGEAEKGHILVTMVQSKDIILLDNDGHVVNLWKGDHYISNSAYLLENGNLLRTVSLEDAFGFAPNGRWGFIAGRVEEVSWDGEVVWSFEYASEKHITHHDIYPMPNGHILMIAFERFTEEEVVAAGFNPELMPERKEIWSESIVEVDPATNEIVWEWYLWDHLIQDFDENAPNYGVVAEHPERVNLNYKDPDLNPEHNWWHVNGVAYNEELDQIVLSPRRYSEIWVIDHSSSSEEARGEAGHLLYRWGNPATYNTGTEADRQLYFQHNPTWIPDGYPGAGNMLIYDNGGQSRPYSRVVEMTPPVDANGVYLREDGQPFEPAEVVWEYIAPNPGDFFSSLISSAQRQPNGNTLITEGLLGRIFEVNPSGEIVWDYNLPPAAWAFKSQRYNLPVFADHDLTANLEFVGGVVWQVDCEDGRQQRLYQYLPQESATMDLFISTHGDNAEAEWQLEACAEPEDSEDGG